MIQKIRVAICTGTACYVRGGAELLDLESRLPAELTGLIELEGASCLELCRDRAKGQPPFALVGEKVIAAATIETLIDAIAAACGACGGADSQEARR